MKRNKTYQPRLDRNGYVINLPPLGGRQRFETVLLTTPRGFSPNDYIDLTGLDPIPRHAPSPKKAVSKSMRPMRDSTVTRQSVSKNDPITLTTENP